MLVATGDCFVRPDFGGQHLNIVLTDFKGDPPAIILINLTSWKPYKDQTVILTWATTRVSWESLS